jgi:hypothetical protein
MLDDVDLSPFICGSSNLTPQARVRSPSSTQWVRSPSFEKVENGRLSNGDVLTSMSDSIVRNDYFHLSPTTTKSSSHYEDHFIEHCTAERCFFGCRGHHSAAADALPPSMSAFSVDHGLSGDLLEVERERDFGNPYSLASDQAMYQSKL